MADRIGKGSGDDPFYLDDGVKGRKGHNILGNGAKSPLSTRVTGNGRKRKPEARQPSFPHGRIFITDIPVLFHRPNTPLLTDIGTSCQ